MDPLGGLSQTVNWILYNNKEDREKKKDENLVEALFKLDIYKFSNNDDD